MRSQTITPKDERRHQLGAQESLIAWCTENGVSADGVLRIDINADGSAVFTVAKFDEYGKRYRDGDELAKETVTVATPTELPEAWR